jgi:hypothetical protein
MRGDAMGFSTNGTSDTLTIQIRTRVDAGQLTTVIALDDREFDVPGFSCFAVMAWVCAVMDPDCDSIALLNDAVFRFKLDALDAAYLFAMIRTYMPRPMPRQDDS